MLNHQPLSSDELTGVRIVTFIEALNRLDTLKPAEEQAFLAWMSTQPVADWPALVQRAYGYAAWRNEQPLE